jgi:hypothetical protein
MDRRQRRFLAAIAAVAVLLWVASYGAYSGPKEFLYHVTLTDVLLVVFTAVLAYFTYLLYEATRQLRKQAQRQDRHYTLTERGYLELVHQHPGLTWTDGCPGFQIQIINKGSTPCRLVDFKIGFAFWQRRTPTDLPPPPKYDDKAEYIQQKAFLVPGGYIFSGGRLKQSEINYEAQATAGARSGWVLLAYCRVEYSDVFGDHHYAGWGREYEPVNEGKENNLGYLPSEEYNYDLPADQK